MHAPASAATTASGWSGRHAVELYVRTYSTMLQSSGEIRLDTLTHAHLGMASSLHPLAGQRQMDMGAFLYSMRRLPLAINHADVQLDQRSLGTYRLVILSARGLHRGKLNRTAE